MIPIHIYDRELHIYDHIYIYMHVCLDVAHPPAGAGAHSLRRACPHKPNRLEPC